MSLLFVYISCYLISTKSDKNDYYMQSWITLTNTLPFSDADICVGFDYDSNKEIITLIGGTSPSDGYNRICQFNISSNTTQCEQENTYDIWCGTSNFVSINKNMYLLNGRSGKVLVFDMAQNSFVDTFNQPPTSNADNRCIKMIHSLSVFFNASEFLRGEACCR
eukprot:511582_1